ncbi:hypothetical protein QTH87_13145 [Variovorax sp. J22P168]|uniref:hypothetical protein n=1 Tax=Variovorax jilinensis TaxID=3053513 RepID=UPI002575D244|nr:hypothetical protein [Variovorax sp. J22P168]MDM0013382.1 hypothetical protein [Variovorax sp. J22P168]
MVIVAVVLPLLALSTALRHAGIALALAAANFPQEHGVTAAILLCLLLNIAVSMPWVMWQRGRISTAITRRSA